MTVALLIALQAASPVPAIPATAIDAERAFVHDAQTIGQWTAFRETAAPEAVRFVPQRVNARDCLKSQKDPAEAVKTNPELAGAYGVVAAVAKKAEADGLPAERQAAVVARARENVAASIERGEAPSMQMRDEVTRSRGRDAER